ncbi:MAG TPA: cation diffusion facilitator family transporter [Acidimicrobiales bacterium]|nr:cation diffusion facilitator family transporter [Acidimicrobiales bacterium]
MSRERRLVVVFGLNALLLAGLVVVGLVAHSLGVLSAAGDYLADALAIALSLFTVRLAHRTPTTRRSYGYERSTILAALVNAALVVAAMTVVVVAAIERLVHGAPKVHGGAVIVISALAAGVMFIGVLVLRGDDDLNVRAILLDTTADALTGVCVAITGLVILVTGGLYWLDPAVALVVAVIIGYRATGLVREVADVLLESTPKGLDVHEVEAVMCDGVAVGEVHDLHIWSLSSDVLLLSAHLVLTGHPTLEQAQEVVEQVKRRLSERFDIGHATLEAECEVCADPDPHSAAVSAQDGGYRPA